MQQIGKFQLRRVLGKGASGTVYLALDTFSGNDVALKVLDPEDAIQIAFKSCGALDYAFRQGIVHRDIKPANIMVVNGTNINVASRWISRRSGA